MGSVFGKKIKISLFGESHGAGLGVVIDNFPCGVKIDFDEIKREMARRRPGGKFATKRNEADEFEVLSGIYNDTTTGAPICAIIRNTDTHSKDYGMFRDIPRPSHSDYPAHVKFKGFNDIRGGGHFSARVTAPLVFAGALAKQALKPYGITVGVHIYKIKDIYDTPFSLTENNEYEKISYKDFPVISDESGEKMKAVIENARTKLDSVGGIVECGIYGFPAGIGDPFFDSVESVISHMMFSVPAVKGIEFGDGFGVTDKYGSQNNDRYLEKDGKITTVTNNAGGICGGISTGMPIVFRLAFKPTPSIYKEQNTLNIKTHKNTQLKIEGRHDPCVAVRGVPVTEAAAAICALQLIYDNKD